jgi:16S rRNA G966 N2-methylase RsmD
VFVEPDRFRCRLIRDHARRFGVDGQCRAVEQGAESFARRCSDRFDIIYFDPPYDEPWAGCAARALLGCVATEGVLVYERRSRRGTSDGPVEGMPPPSDRRVYGETEICFFQPPLPGGTPQSEPA